MGYLGLRQDRHGNLLDPRHFEQPVVDSFFGLSIPSSLVTSSVSILLCQRSNLDPSMHDPMIFDKMAIQRVWSYLVEQRQWGD